ncbi:MAG: response regulator transcription factor [Chloroflexaceae bacterium]|nr:response regulator transcription factor [Chloroflexaceae bacterium]
MAIRVVLAETRHRSGLKIRPLLDAHGDLEVVGEADTGAAAQRLVLRHRPDVLVADFDLPAGDGLQVARNLRHLKSRTSVVLLLEKKDAELVRRALRTGAQACIVRAMAAEELLLAIRVALRDQEERQAVVATAARRPHGDHGTLARSVARSYVTHMDPFQRLSPRERQILQLLAEGHSLISIARHLTLPLKVLQTHQAALLLKLSVQDRATGFGLMPVALPRGAAYLNG